MPTTFVLRLTSLLTRSNGVARVQGLTTAGPWPGSSTASGEPYQRDGGTVIPARRDPSGDGLAASPPNIPRPAKARRRRADRLAGWLRRAGAEGGYCTRTVMVTTGGESGGCI